MDQQSIERIEKVLSSRYLLVSKGRFYYGVGGAVAAIALIAGISIQSIAEAIDDRIREEVSTAVADAEAQVSELESLVATARSTVRSAEAEIVALREDGPGTTRTIHYEDGQIISERGRGGTMVVEVTGRIDGNPSSVPIDHSRLLELCSDLDGCDVSMAVSPFGVEMTSGRRLPGLFAPGTGGDCRFYISAEGHWSLENGCVIWRQRIEIDPDDRYGFLNPSEADEVLGFRPYNSASGFGIDGDAEQLADGTVRPNTLSVMSYSSACYFSEAGISELRSGPRYLPDDDVGFHLIMAGADWSSYPVALFPPRDPDRRCVLVFKD